MIPRAAGAGQSLGDGGGVTMDGLNIATIGKKWRKKIGEVKRWCHPLELRQKDHFQKKKIEKWRDPLFDNLCE